MKLGGEESREQLLSGILLFLLAIAVYYPVLNNFFTWDDFLWVYRAKTLAGNPFQIFAIDAVYFDPLVYLWFWIDFQLHGLNPFWYHLGDVTIHAANGFLLYLLVRKLAKDRFAALACSIIFVSSFAVVDAVAWSSSRVDLLMVFFSLLTLLFFLSHLADGGRRAFAMSMIAYVLALSAKGTPLLLPCLLAVILHQRGEFSRKWRLLLPYLVTIIIYASLLIWRLSVAGIPVPAGTKGLNFYNFFLSLGELFVPELHLASLNITWVAIVIILLLCLCGFLLTGLHRSTAIFGLALIGVGLVPVLILKDFKMVTMIQNAGQLLNSPSHRIYLASAGAACCSGTILAALFRRFNSYLLGSILLMFLVTCSFYEIRLREALWSGSARYIRNSVEGIANYKKLLLDDSAIGLVNFPMSRGFMRPALSLYCDLDRVYFLPMASIPSEIPDAPEILRYRGRGYFFVYANDKVINLSPPFARLLDIAFLYQISDNREKIRLASEYSFLATEMNTAISDSFKSFSNGFVDHEI